MKRCLIYMLLISLCCALALYANAALTLPVTDNFPSGGAEQSWEDYDSSYETIVNRLVPPHPEAMGT